MPIQAIAEKTQDVLSRAHQVLKPSLVIMHGKPRMRKI